MKVTHVIAPGGVGGAESVVLGGVAALREIGVDADLLVLDERRKPTAAEPLLDGARANGVPVRTIAVRRRLDPKLLVRLRKELGETAAVHAHGYKAVVYAGAAAGRRALYATHHGVVAIDAKASLYDGLALTAYTRMRRVFAVSDATRRHLLRRGVPPRKVLTLHNFVALDALPDSWAPPEVEVPGRVRLLYLGRLSHEKGADVLLRALAWTSDPRIVLDIAGDGPEIRRLERQAAELSLEERVRFLGFRTDVVERILAAHALVLPSRSEGLPMAMVEAMALGRPVIATAVGGIPEVYDARLGGALVSPDDPAALAAALDSFAADVDGRLAAAAGGVAASRERFSPRRWAERTADVYGSGA